MNQRFAALAFLAVFTFGVGASAQEVAATPNPTGGFKRMAVGGVVSLGMAHVIGDNGDGKPRFAGGGSAYFDFYLLKILALEANLGFVGKGYRGEITIEGLGDNYEVDYKCKLIYMEIGLGAKLNISQFRAALLFVPAFGLSGKVKTDDEKDDFEWDNYHRVNLGLKIGAGYGIPIGPITLVPGLDWSIHLINDYDGSGDTAIRSMNLMLNIGAEIGLPFGK